MPISSILFVNVVWLKAQDVKSTKQPSKREKLKAKHNELKCLKVSKNSPAQTEKHSIKVKASWGRNAKGTFAISIVTTQLQDYNTSKTIKESIKETRTVDDVCILKWGMPSEMGGLWKDSNFLVKKGLQEKRWG